MYDLYEFMNHEKIFPIFDPPSFYASGADFDFDIAFPH